MIPPGIIMIRIDGRNNKMLNLWLPIVILWPIYIIAIIFIAPIAFVAECFLIRSGIRPFSILIALIRVIAALKGISVKIEKNKGDFDKRRFKHKDNVNVIIM